MISSSTFRYLILSINIIWLGGGTNFRIIQDGNQLKVLLSKSFFRKAYQYLHQIVNLVYVIFVAYRLIKFTAIEVSDDDDDQDEIESNKLLSKIMQTSYVLTCYTVSVLLDIQTILKGDTIPYFILEYVKVFREIGNVYFVKSEKPNLVKCNAFLTTLFIVGNTIYLQNFILMKRKPWTAHFLVSLLPQNSTTVLQRFLRIPLILTQCWVWWNLWANIYFYIFNVYIYICCALRLIKELNPTFKIHHTTAKLRETTHFIRTLVTLRLLHFLFKDVYREWFQPTQKYNTMFIATLAMCGVIKLDGRQRRIMGLALLFSVLYLASLYRKLGLLFENSVQLRRAVMIAPTSSKWLRRWIKGMRDFRVDVGHFYFVHRTTVVTILYTILNGTITLLLGLK